MPCSLLSSTIIATQSAQYSTAYPSPNRYALVSTDVNGQLNWVAPVMSLDGSATPPRSGVSGFR